MPNAIHSVFSIIEECNFVHVFASTRTTLYSYIAGEKANTTNVFILYWSVVCCKFKFFYNVSNTHSLLVVQCTRTCGGGLQTRSIVCADQDGVFSTSTSGCGNPTGTNRPPCIEFCNQFDCTTREQICNF